MEGTRIQMDACRSSSDVWSGFMSIEYKCMEWIRIDRVHRYAVNSCRIEFKCMEWIRVDRVHMYGVDSCRSSSHL